MVHFSSGLDSSSSETGTKHIDHSQNLKFPSVEIGIEEFVDIPILYYAYKIGSLPNNYKQDEDLVLFIKDGPNLKKYIYNHQYNSLSVHDTTGSKYFNKDDEESNKEKLFLVYELKKLYLKKIEDECIQKLENGEFNKDDLIVKHRSLSENILEQKIKSIDEVIEIINESSTEYIISFGEQVQSFVKVFRDLKQKLDELNQEQWEGHEVNLINSFFQNIQKSFQPRKEINVGTIDLKKEQKQKFVNKCIDFIQAKNFEEDSLEELKNFQEYRELYLEESEESLKLIINDIKHQILMIRKLRLEKKLNEAKVIEEEIKDKQKEIRKFRGGFTDEYKLLEKDEERYKRLLKAQELKTNQIYREGFSKTAEKTKEDKYKNEIRYCKYDVNSEAKDIEEISKTVGKEMMKIKSKEEYISTKTQNLVNLREDKIPSLENERDLLKLITEMLMHSLEKNKKTKSDINSNIQEEYKKINQTEVTIARYTEKINTLYRNLGLVLPDIEDLKNEIKRLETAKSAVRSEEIIVFKDTIFEKAGGQKRGESDTGYVNHQDCKPNLPLGTTSGHCLYRSATDDSVDFALKKIESNVLELNEKDLFDSLPGYTHSAAGGSGKHAPELKNAAKRVFIEYHAVENRIKKREKDYQNQINENKQKLAKKNAERDKLRSEIIEKENKLNESNIQLNEIEQNRENLVQQQNQIEDHIYLLKNYLETANSLQLSVNEEIDKKKEQIIEVIDNIETKEEEISELETEIFKDGEHNHMFALAETRWRYSQYERIITNIGGLDKQKSEQIRLKEEISIVLEKLEACERQKIKSDLELKTVKEKIGNNLTAVKNLIKEKDDMIAMRSLLEKQSTIGLANSMEAYQKELKKLKELEANEIKSLNKIKLQIIKREIYNGVDLNNKGTTNGTESYRDDVGTVNQLYKKRMHKNCQDVIQSCKYFDAIDFIITKLILEPDIKDNAEIYKELESKQDHYKTHVIATHKSDLEKIVGLVKIQVKAFQTKIENIKSDYTKKQTVLIKKMKDIKERIISERKLDGVLFIKNYISRTPEQDNENIQNYLDAGVDCVVIDRTEIYTLKTAKKRTVQEFIQDILSNSSTLADVKPDVFNSEIKRILDSYKTVSLETMLLETQNSDKKKVYELLVQYFDKTYLKKKLDIEKKLNITMKLEQEARNITDEIQQLDKENIKLRRIHSELEKNLKLNDKEMETLDVASQNLYTMKTIESTEVKSFERMKNLYTKLLEKSIEENKNEKEDILNYKHNIKHLKSMSKTVDMQNEVVNDIILKVMQNRLKIALDVKHNKHRSCVGSSSEVCDYFNIVNILIKNTAKQFQERKITCKPPEYRISNEIKTNLIQKLNLKGQHSERHEDALKRIIDYFAIEYGQETRKLHNLHKNLIEKIEWKIAKLNNQIETRDEIVIPELTRRITELENFFSFKKDESFRVESFSEDITQKELKEYKEAKFKLLVKRQVNYLIAVLQKLDANKHSFQSAVLSFYEVFKEFYKDLNANESIITQIILKLNKEVNEDTLESSLKSLIMKKTSSMGGAAYILRKVSNVFQQNQKDSNETLNLEQIYYEILHEEDQIKLTVDKATLQALQKDLLVLEARKREFFMQDTSLLREELENIENCIRYIESAKEVGSLKSRIEDLDETKRNKDDYYAFEMDNRRVCIRLLNTDSLEKSSEIKNIDRIRKNINEQNEYFLEKKVLRQKYSQELIDEREKWLSVSCLEIQRNLFVKGISLCGYDTFQNGITLDEVNSFISVIISNLLGEDSVYQINGINEVTKEIEEYTREIRFKYDSSLNKLTKLDTLELIANIINQEFESDDLHISNINIIEDKKKMQTINLGKHLENSRQITLLLRDAKYFALVPRDEIEMYNQNKPIDIRMKISNLLSVLQTEEDLFRHVCQERFEKILGITLETSKQLAESYKKENQNLSKISSLKDFSALFCGVLSLTNALESPSFSLFAYLVYLEKLENEIKREDIPAKMDRLKIIKNIYKKALIQIINVEQRRRQNENATKFQESREELYIRELIKDREAELESLLDEIRNREEVIEKDQELVKVLLSKKEAARDVYKEKIQQLSEVFRNLKDNLEFARNRIKELNQDEKKNQEKIKEAEKLIIKLEKEQRKLEKEIMLKEKEKRALEVEIGELKTKEKELLRDQKLIIAEKEKRENEEKKKRKEIDASKDLMKLIENLKTALADITVQSKLKEMEKHIYESHDLKSLLEELQKISIGSASNFWELLIKDINYDQLKDFINGNKTLAGELPRDLLNRFKSIIRDGMKVECEIVQEIQNGIPVKKFKVLATHVNYKDLHYKVKEYVEKIMLTEGLSFNGDLLYSSEYGVTKIKELPEFLRILVERRIELFYKTEEVESKKNAEFKNAASVVNDLKINYLDVVSSFIDEIEIVCSGKFILNDSISYPGVDLTINAVDMECVGDNLTLDTSGTDGKQFVHKASDGRIKRGSDNKPRGDSGHDGYDGDHGNHAGNIVIRVENTIRNLEGLKLVKANGGNGGQGQLGGNGDEGLKGINGEDGVAKDTSGFGGGQICIGLGKPGKPGGRGGSPGKTGRPGKGGKPGIIEIVHKEGKLTLGESNPGRDSDDILDKMKPEGGEGGEPGMYGMDQIKEKKSFFHKTKTFPYVVDRAALLEKHPRFRNEIINSGQLTDTNSKVSLFALLGVALAPITGGLSLITMGTAAVISAFEGSSTSYEAGKKLEEYLNRDHNNKSMRGLKNEEQAQLRNDYRTPQQNKREVVNIDTLHNKLNEKKLDENEITGKELHQEHISDLMVEQEELVDDIEKNAQEANDIQVNIQNIVFSIETKGLELEKVSEDIQSLKNMESKIDAQTIEKINEIMRFISTSQKLRDKKGIANLDMIQTLNKLQNYTLLEEEFSENKENLIRIIDEYLNAIKERLKIDRRNLKSLKNDFSNKQSDIRFLNKKLIQLQQERISQVLTDVQIEQEIEEEMEAQYVEEILHITGFEDTNIYLESKYTSNRKISTDPYITTKHRFDAKNIPKSIDTLIYILNQSIRHYRAGVLKDENIESIINAFEESCMQNGFSDNEFKQVVQSFKNEIKEIRINRNMSTLSSIERYLLLGYLKQISVCLKIDHLSNLSNIIEGKVFLLKMIQIIEKTKTQDDSIAKKLQTRFEGKYLLGNDKLNEDIDLLIRLIDSRKIFYLEQCAINFSENFDSQSECEKKMLIYNKDPNILNLLSVIREFKLNEPLALRSNEKEVEHISKEYFESLSGFLSVTLENIRYHAALLLINIIENNSLNQKKSYKFNEIELITGVKTNSKLNAKTRTIQKITEILNLFEIAIKSLKETTMSKKEINRCARSLEEITNKLIKYIEYDSKSNQEIEKVVNNYLVMEL